MTQVSRPYKGVSAQDRRAERRARLREAGLDLIGEEGVAGVSAEAVAARAGLTKRYFYESFSDRDALLDAALDDFFTEVRAEILDALTGTATTRADRAHTLARVLIDFLSRDPRRARLYVEAPGHPRLAARRERAFDTFGLLLLEAFPPDTAPPDTAPPDTTGPDRPAEESYRALAALIVVAGTTQAATTWLRGGLELTRPELVDGLARVILAALPPSGR